MYANREAGGRPRYGDREPAGRLREAQEHLRKGETAVGSRVEHRQDGRRGVQDLAHDVRPALDEQVAGQSHQAVEGGAVRHDESGEAQLAAEHVREQAAARRAGQSVDLGVGGHQPRHPGGHRGPYQGRWISCSSRQPISVAAQLRPPVAAPCPALPRA
ncbi:hypothetical protein GCM10018793_09510 [Streptomyces sulfonofaciens]|uniref:Uncharacterized protein n=1 Tax=Streptomyces sulfonofaciens TaxID=68272 RepID=A0A919KU05_9ACTN|nr:hypothetical protein GCM10018793_09510 [Streptomyces sulfonofaciens]